MSFTNFFVRTLKELSFRCFLPKNIIFILKNIAILWKQAREELFFTVSPMGGLKESKNTWILLSRFFPHFNIRLLNGILQLIIVLITLFYRQFFLVMRIETIFRCNFELLLCLKDILLAFQIFSFLVHNFILNWKIIIV